MRSTVRFTLSLIVLMMFGVISAQAQYVEAHKIDTVSKDLPEAQLLTVLSAHLGVPSDTLKKQKTETGLPTWGQLYIFHALAKASKADVSQLLADSKTKSLGEIAKARKIKMKDIDDDVAKLEKDLKSAKK